MTSLIIDSTPSVMFSFFIVPSSLLLHQIPVQLVALLFLIFVLLSLLVHQLV